MKHLVNTCLLAATCVTGCSSPSTATEADYDDVAQALTSVVVTDNNGGEVGAMVDATNIARGDGSLAFKVDASGKYTGNHLGLDYQYSATCTDAEGTQQPACNKSSDSADVMVNWSGDLTLPRLTANVMRNGSWQLSGLQGDTVSFAGSGDLELDAQMQSLFRNVSRTYHFSYNATYEDVALQRSEHKITGGRVTYNIEAERMASGTQRQADAQFSMNGVLEFMADGSATLTLDHSYTYNVDLKTGQLTKQ